MNIENLKQVLKYFIFPAIVYFIHLLAYNFTNFYIEYFWFDILMHFIGGASIAITFALIFEYLEKQGLVKIKSKLLFILIIVSIVSFFAVLWEFWEFIMITYFNFNWNLTYEDTLFDLFMGILGGFLASIFIRR